MSAYYQAARDNLAAELHLRDIEVPDELLDLYTLLLLSFGTQVATVDVHDAWAVWTLRLNPEHRSLIPFRELTREVQELDQPYCDAITAAAHRTTR